MKRRATTKRRRKRRRKKRKMAQRWWASMKYAVPLQHRGEDQMDADQWDVGQWDVGHDQQPSPQQLDVTTPCQRQSEPPLGEWVDLVRQRRG